MEDPQSTSSRADQSSVTVAVFPLMEDSLERLKYLNYEKEFCLPRKRPLLDNLTFIYPAKKSVSTISEFVGIICMVARFNYERS